MSNDMHETADALCVRYRKHVRCTMPPGRTAEEADRMKQMVEEAGTEGTLWMNDFLHRGFGMFSTGKGGEYVAEKAEANTGWLFPVGDDAHDLGYSHMFTDMFDSIDQGRPPKETF